MPPWVDKGKNKLPSVLEFSGAVGREGINSRLSHYHETSGLAQTREESVHTTLRNPALPHRNTCASPRGARTEYVSKFSTLSKQDGAAES